MLAGRSNRVFEREGKYRIQAVAEMTGIPAATLRAWERRYGLPDPGRTESSYRLYSDHDIAMVRRVRELCDAGMAPSEAARTVLEEADTWNAAPANNADPYDRARQAIVEAVAAFDPRQAENAVRHAMALGSATAIYDRVFAPAMREIGERWHAGEIGVAQEHLATGLLDEAAATMLRLVQREDAERTILLACFADEEHDFPSYGIALHMSSWGYRLVRLGARTPPQAVHQAVQELDPVLVALSVTMIPAPHRARELVEGYARACDETPWVVGGDAAGPLSRLIEEQGGTVIASYEPGRLKGLVEGLLARRRRTPKPPTAKRKE